ncbi:MAG: helix-turn-helix domain-containing protein [Myxococcota bacterium]|nr:hypothetical protein [Myxococcales bacterium]
MQTHPLRAHEPRATSPEPAPDTDLEAVEALLRAGGSPGSPLELREWLELAEAWYIARTLRALRGNRSAAARVLGIGRRTLYAKMQKLGIEASWQPGRRG